MDGLESLGDAEMRFVTVNGQTVMLEGDLCGTNELLNEMLLIGNGKEENGGECNIEIGGNPCVNGLRGVSEDPTKIALTIQGENNELQTIHIGMNEAKELGLYIYGIKNEGIEEWNQTCTVNNGSLESQEQISVVSITNVKEGGLTRDTESVNKVKLESMPLLDVDSPDKDDNIMIQSADSGKENITNGQLNGVQFDSCNNSNQKADVQEENSSDNFPAIGHLEGFQIPTADDGTLLPATVNAKMADGSYQMLTLIPQIGDGNVTYSVQFANLDSDEIDSKTFNDSVETVEEYNIDNLCNDIEDKDIQKSKKCVVEEFLKSVQLKKNDKLKSSENIEPVTVADDKNSTVSFVNLSMDQNILKLNNGNNFTVPGSFSFDNLSVNYVPQSQIQTPIEAKIDNLITENENVIAKCKKVKYGKKIRQTDANETNEILQKINNMAKRSLVRGKKVKFKNRSNAKALDEEIEEKKMKLSILKTNSDQVQEKKEETLHNSVESESNNFTNSNSNKNLISHVNLNCRLEYPNLKAIDDNASLPYLKMKAQPSPKQPYFNVLPYPKDKTIPVQKQYLPFSCDIQQAKNLISLQKFLETQKLQLKIQPINSSGNKMVNIRPKPTLNDQLKTLQDLGLAAPVVNGESILTNNSFIQAANQETKKNYTEVEENVQANNSKDVLLGEGKMSLLKFLNTSDFEQEKSAETEASNDFDGKIDGIFIKNNPDYFQKNKDGKAEEHPLGSSENPIQLVQTGHTFHSRQPLSETQLRQIASILQKQKFDSQNIKKNSIFDPKTNTRIVYRVVYPEDVELKRSDENLIENSIKKKRGRHRTKPASGEDDLQKPLGKGPRRPKKITLSSLDEEMLEVEVEDTQVEQPKKIPRTRSGRLSRPPRYMVKDYKRINNSDVSEKNSNPNYESDEAYSDYINDKEGTKERVNKMDELENTLLPGLRSPTRSKRNFKPEYRCPTCQKIYLGHSRMMWHLNKFPDHCNVEKYKEIYTRKPTETKVRRRRLNMCDVSANVKQVLSSMSKDELTSVCGPVLAEALTTWDFLLLRVNLLKEDMRSEVDSLLHELAFLVEKLTKIAEDIFLPVFTKEGEKDEDCVQIDKMEIAIALGLPVGFYKVNNDNLKLLKLPLKTAFQEKEDKESEMKVGAGEGGNISNEEKSFLEKTDNWEKKKKKKKDDDKKLVEDFWMNEKANDADNWQRTDESASVKVLATKFEPNLSTKLLESSNDSIDDTKYEEPVPLIDLDSNSKDVEHSNSSGNLDRSPGNKGHSENSVSADVKTVEKELWNTQGEGKVSSEIWSEHSNMTAAVEKSSAQLWSDKANLGSEKRELWNENSNMNSNEKVDEANSEFLDSFLAVGNLGSESNGFLGESLMKRDKTEESVKVDSREGGNENFIRIWDSDKSGEWSKDTELLSGGIHERMPGLRTSNRLTSTPETNGNINFTIPNRRNSISDFTNINLEPSGLDIVLPPAKTLIKERTKSDSTREAYPLKNNVFENSDTMKDWNQESGKTDFSSSNVNSEDLMKIALESLTSHNDVITVQPTSFDSAMGILNPTQESGNLNLFTSGETDGLDFNLPLPDHLLRTNFTTSSTFQTTSNYSSTVSPTFLSTANSLFGTTTSSSMDQFEANYQGKKAEDDVIEFFDTKNPYTSYETCIEGGGNVANFSFVSTSSHSDQYSVTQCLSDSIVSAFVPEAKKKGGEEAAAAAAASKSRVKKKERKSNRGVKLKKVKTKRVVDYPKTNSIESIINEALFESCATQCSNKSKSIQMENSSPSGTSITSTIPNGTDNYTLPIIPESLDEVGNLDFLNQD